MNATNWTTGKQSPRFLKVGSVEPTRIVSQAHETVGLELLFRAMDGTELRVMLSKSEFGAIRDVFDNTMQCWRMVDAAGVPTTMVRVTVDDGDEDGTDHGIDCPICPEDPESGLPACPVED